MDPRIWPVLGSLSPSVSFLPIGMLELTSSVFIWFNNFWNIGEFSDWGVFFKSRLKICSKHKSSSRDEKSNSRKIFVNSSFFIRPYLGFSRTSTRSGATTWAKSVRGNPTHNIYHFEASDGQKLMKVDDMIRPIHMILLIFDKMDIPIRPGIFAYLNHQTRTDSNVLLLRIFNEFYG